MKTMTPGIRSDIDTCVFDAYGTLFDVNTGSTNIHPTSKHLFHNDLVNE